MTKNRGDRLLPKGKLQDILLKRQLVTTQSDVGHTDKHSLSLSHSVFGGIPKPIRIRVIREASL